MNGMLNSDFLHFPCLYAQIRISLKIPFATFKKNDNNYYELNHFCREDNSNLCLTGQKERMRTRRKGRKTAAAKKWQQNSC